MRQERPLGWHAERALWLAYVAPAATRALAEAHTHAAYCPASADRTIVYQVAVQMDNLFNQPNSRAGFFTDAIATKTCAEGQVVWPTKAPKRTAVAKCADTPAGRTWDDKHFLQWQCINRSLLCTLCAGQLCSHVLTQLVRIGHHKCAERVGTHKKHRPIILGAHRPRPRPWRSYQ